MTTTPPQITDRNSLLQHRSRALPSADKFLHQIAIDEVQDRLAVVNKTFTNVAIVTAFPDLWQSAFPQAICVSDPEVLPLETGQFDLVVHAMTLHWANDPVGQLIQCRRALQEDGFFLCLTLGGQTLHELRAVLAQAESEISGGLSPRVAPMGEIRDLGALLQRAGFTLPVADLVPLGAEYRDLRHLAQDLRAMGETNALTDRLRTPSRRALFDRAEALYRDHYPGKTNALHASFEMIVLTGWSPSDSQPQPLRPGSAQARLADALGVDETALDD